MMTYYLSVDTFQMEHIETTPTHPTPTNPAPPHPLSSTTLSTPTNPNPLPTPAHPRVTVSASMDHALCR